MTKVPFFRLMVPIPLAANFTALDSDPKAHGILRGRAASFRHSQLRQFDPVLAPDTSVDPQSPLILIRGKWSNDRRSVFADPSGR